jgi:hypothetical protein
MNVVAFAAINFLIKYKMLKFWNYLVLRKIYFYRIAAMLRCICPTNVAAFARILNLKEVATEIRPKGTGTPTLADADAKRWKKKKNHFTRLNS